jgi:hypothetical protein
MADKLEGILEDARYAVFLADPKSVDPVFVSGKELLARGLREGETYAETSSSIEERRARKDEGATQ